MKCHSCLLAPLLSLALSLPARAGTTDHSISADLAATPAIAAEDGWQFTAGMPGWLAGLEGDFGIKGLSPVHVNVPFSEILHHLDMVAALTLEAQHGRWSLYTGGLYMKLGGDASPSGPLVNSASLEIKQVIAEAGVAYHLWEGKRGYFDVIAGARYYYMSGSVHLDVSESGVRNVSQDLSNSLVNQVTSTVQNETSAALSKAQSEIDSAVAAAKVRVSSAVLTAKNGIATNVTDLTTAARDKVTDAVTGKVQGAIDNIIKDYPHLPEFVGGSGPVRDAIRQLVDAKVSAAAAQVSAAKAAASSQIQSEVAAKKQAVKAVVNAKLQAASDQLRAEADRIKSQANRAVARAEQNLAKQIQSAITKALPAETSGSQSWVDPFVGFRARYNFTDQIYLMARADIGGFGLDAKLDWQAYGALGWQFNRHWSAELGYRYLSVDYENNGFVFDAAMRGAFLGLNYNF